MNERQRNEFAFTFERFRRVGDNQNAGVGLTDMRDLVFRLMDRRQEEHNEHTQSAVDIDRLATLARAVREQLLRQVTDADLYRSVVPRAETVAISQDERQRDLLLIQSQAHVNVELAAISYLEQEGDVVNAIMALTEGTAQRARLVEGLRQRQAHLGLQVTTNLDEEGLSEERREVLREARRAFQRAAALASRTDLGANTFIDGHRQEWRNGAVYQAPLPNRMHERAYGHLGPKPSPRKTRGRELVLKSLRASMEELEEQVEACAIDEGTYHEKAMELKEKFEAVSYGNDDEAMFTTRPRFFHSPDWYEARNNPNRPEEVD